MKTKDRFKGFDWMKPILNNEAPIIEIIGCGGIGSNLAYLLGRIGYKLEISDFDIVEPHNLGGQFFANNQINIKKVDAIRGVLKAFTSDSDYNKYRDERKNKISRRYTVMAVDNQSTRNNLFNHWKESLLNDPDNKDNTFLIDASLTGETYHLYYLDKRTSEEYILKYKEYLDKIIKNEIGCTVKQTSHIAMRLAADITVLINNYFSNKINKKDFRKLYFHKSFNAVLNKDEIEYY